MAEHDGPRTPDGRAAGATLAWAALARFDVEHMLAWLYDEKDYTTRR